MDRWSIGSQSGVPKVCHWTQTVLYKLHVIQRFGKKDPCLALKMMRQYYYLHCPTASAAWRVLISDLHSIILVLSYTHF
jgi:hypothetical protein